MSTMKNLNTEPFVQVQLTRHNCCDRTPSASGRQGHYQAYRQPAPMELEGFSRHAGSFSAADAGTGRICAEQGSLCYGEPSARGQAYPHWCFYRGMNVAQATVTRIYSLFGSWSRSFASGNNASLLSARWNPGSTEVARRHAGCRYRPLVMCHLAQRQILPILYDASSNSYLLVRVGKQMLYSVPSLGSCNSRGSPVNRTSSTVSSGPTRDYASTTKTTYIPLSRKAAFTIDDRAGTARGQGNAYTEIRSDLIYMRRCPGGVKVCVDQMAIVGPRHGWAKVFKAWMNMHDLPRSDLFSSSLFLVLDASFHETAAIQRSLRVFDIPQPLPYRRCACFCFLYS